MGLLRTTRIKSTVWLAKQLKPYLEEQLISTLVSGYAPQGEKSSYFSGSPLTQLELTSLASPLVKPNIDLIAATASQPILRVEQQKPGTEEWVPVVNHELERILNVYPFPDFGANLAWRFTFTWLMLRGEAYWMIIPNGFGEITGLLPIPAYMMKPVPWQSSFGGSPKLINHFLYAPNDPSETIQLPAELVLFHRLPNLIYPYRGWSPLVSYELMLKTVGEADRFDYEDYKNGLGLAKIFSLPQGTKPKDFMQMKKDYDDAQVEGRRDQFVRAGDLTVQDIVQRRGDTGQNVHKRGMELADRVLGVPKGVRGDDVTFASAKVAEDTFRRDTINGLTKLRDEDINGKVTFPLYGEGYRVKTDSAVTGTEKEKREADEFKQRSWMVNEVRKLQNLPPHPDSSIGQAIMYRVDPVQEDFVPAKKSIPVPERSIPGPERSILHDDSNAKGLEGRCPLCYSVGTVQQYEDHKGLCLCMACNQTFDLEAGWSLEKS